MTYSLKPGPQMCLADGKMWEEVLRTRRRFVFFGKKNQRYEWVEIKDGCPARI